MTMREKIARVLCTAHYIHHDGAASPEGVNREVSGKYSEYWFNQADAALDALMMPTPIMCERGFAVVCKYDTGDYAPDTEVAPDTFKTMIRAAKEGK